VKGGSIRGHSYRAVIAQQLPKTRLFLRLEHNQWAFAVSARAAYDVAIVNSRYASPYPKGHKSHGRPPDRLVKAVGKAGRDIIFDPGTPPLVSRAIKLHRSTERLRETQAAKAVELPLSLEALGHRRIRDAFVDACLREQSASRFRVPPYLDFGSIGDAFEINIKMIRRALAAAGPGRTIAFLQVTSTKLLSGLLREAAVPVAKTGLQRVILRVRDLGEEAGDKELDAILDAIAAFSEQGVEVIVDCAGRLGPLLVHQGAAGFSTGPEHFRKVAKELLQPGGGGGGIPLRYEAHGRWQWVARGEIGKTASACPVPGCKVKPGCGLDAIREHNLHVLGHVMQELATWGVAEVIKSLRESESPLAAEWANVLARRRRSAEGGAGSGQTRRP
jgi:hypothetical protein